MKGTSTGAGLWWKAQHCTYNTSWELTQGTQSCVLAHIPCDTTRPENQPQEKTAPKHLETTGSFQSSPGCVKHRIWAIPGAYCGYTVCGNWECGCGQASSLMGYNCEKQVNSIESNETWSAQLYWPITEGNRGDTGTMHEQLEVSKVGLKNKRGRCLQPSKGIWCHSVRADTWSLLMWYGVTL